MNSNEIVTEKEQVEINCVTRKEEMKTMISCEI